MQLPGRGKGPQGYKSFFPSQINSIQINSIEIYFLSGLSHERWARHVFVFLRFFLSSFLPDYFDPRRRSRSAQNLSQRNKEAKKQGTSIAASPPGQNSTMLRAVPPVHI